MKAPPINIKLEKIKQVILLLACIPKANNLIKLNAINKNNNSLAILNKNARANIIMVLVMVKYIPSTPYIISSILSFE